MIIKHVAFSLHLLTTGLDATVGCDCSTSESSEINVHDILICL